MKESYIRKCKIFLILSIVLTIALVILWIIKATNIQGKGYIANPGDTIKVFMTTKDRQMGGVAYPSWQGKFVITERSIPNLTEDSWKAYAAQVDRKKKLRAHGSFDRYAYFDYAKLSFEVDVPIISISRPEWFEGYLSFSVAVAKKSGKTHFSYINEDHTYPLKIMVYPNNGIYRYLKLIHNLFLLSVLLLMICIGLWANFMIPLLEIKKIEQSKTPNVDN